LIVRRSLPLLVLLLAGTASCGRGGPNPQNREPSSGGFASNATSTAAPPAPAAQLSESASDVQGRAAAGGPNVAPSAAPGVAFNYRYSFALAPLRVRELMERHADMCAQLTLAHCKITGMHYRMLGQDDFEATLELKLDPAVARTFGRSATDAVLQADGMLTENEISGVDAGGQIRQTTTDITRLQADLARIQQRLAGRIGDEERAELQAQAEQLREQIRALGDQRQATQESLATTPMVFNYGSGDLVPGYRPPQSLGEALGKAWADFKEGGTAVLAGLIRAAPWLLTLLLIGALALYARRRWFPKAKTDTATEPAEA
jgi:hypothetical protein